MKKNLFNMLIAILALVSKIAGIITTIFEESVTADYVETTAREIVEEDGTYMDEDIDNRVQAAKRIYTFNKEVYDSKICQIKADKRFDRAVMKSLSLRYLYFRLWKQRLKKNAFKILLIIGISIIIALLAMIVF